jgi:hypothetical protein
LDRVLAAQQIVAADLLPATYKSRTWSGDEGGCSVPVVSHTAALFEPYIRPSAVQFMLHLPADLLLSFRTRVTKTRRAWERFVAVRIVRADALPMDPLVLPEAIVLLDRHYNSPMPYRCGRPSLYAVRDEAHLTLRYVDYLSNRLVLRPHNIAFPVELIEMSASELPSDLIVGRIALILNEP